MGTARRMSGKPARPRDATTARAFLQPLSLLAGALVWEMVGLTGAVSWLPPLHAVIARIGSLWAGGDLRKPLADSLGNLLIGYLISAVGGLLVGAAMAVSTKVDQALRIYVDMLMAAPSIMLAPVLFIIFGLSSITLLSVIVLYASVFIISTTRSAIAGTSANLRDMAFSFGASRLQIFVQVVLREAAPEIMTGLRVGMGRAVKGMFNGELFIAVFGLAALDKRFEGSFDSTGILAIALVIVIIGVLLSALIESANRRLNGWLPR